MILMIFVHIQRGDGFPCLGREGLTSATCTLPCPKLSNTVSAVFLSQRPWLLPILCRELSIYQACQAPSQLTFLPCAHPKTKRRVPYFPY